MSPTLLLPVSLLLLAASPGEVVDRVAALVDGEVITLSDLEERAGSEWDRVQRMAPGKERDEARREALRHALDLVVSEKLLAKQAQALGLEVTDAQVDAAVQDIKTRNRFDDAQLEEALRAQGLDRSTFRAQVRRELETYQVLQAKVRGRVKITDDDVRNYYQTHPQEFGGEEEVKVRHIFLPLAANASKAEEEKALAGAARVLERLRAGEDFARVAREASKGPSAEDGGDLGWLRRGTIQKQVEDAAFALKVGQVSPIVRAGTGLHILKVEDRRRGAGRAFEQVSEEIRNRLFEEQVGSYRSEYLKELEKGAHIEVKIPELRG